MRICSIKPTNNFQSIKFEQIFPHNLKEEEAIKNDLDYCVYTPNGWQPIIGFYKTKPLPTVIVNCNSGTIECSNDHIIETEHGLLKANDCNNLKIKTINGEETCTVKNSGIKNLYDVQIPSPHIWYTSGIHSHNSILMPHSGMANVKRGCKVLHVTLELSGVKTALRYAGGLTNVDISKRYETDNKRKIVEIMEKAKKAYGGDLKIFEFSPNEISASHLAQLISRLRKKGWDPDILVVDYLELLISNKNDNNHQEHLRQKKVSTELRQLARNDNVLIFTATQTNRDDPKGSKQSGPNVVGLERVSESHGKLMPMDYVITANQEQDEYNSDNPQLRLFIAKNRNGPKNKTISVSVNYKSFRMEEKQIKAVLK